jgi:hypothetical protein
LRNEGPGSVVDESGTLVVGSATVLIGTVLIGTVLIGTVVLEAVGLGTVTVDPAVGSAATVEDGTTGSLGTLVGGGGSAVVAVDGSPIVVGGPLAVATSVVTGDSAVVELAGVASLEVGVSIVGGGVLMVVVVVVAGVAASVVVGAAGSVVTGPVLVSAWANAIIDGPSPIGITARQASARTTTRLVRTPVRFVAMNTA